MTQFPFGMLRTPDLSGAVKLLRKLSVKPTASITSRSARFIISLFHIGFCPPERPCVVATCPVTPDGLVVGEPLATAELSAGPQLHPEGGKRNKIPVVEPRANRIKLAGRRVLRMPGTPFHFPAHGPPRWHSNAAQSPRSPPQLESEADAEGYGDDADPTIPGLRRARFRCSDIEISSLDVHLRSTISEAMRQAATDAATALIAGEVAQCLSPVLGIVVSLKAVAIALIHGLGK